MHKSPARTNRILTRAGNKLHAQRRALSTFVDVNGVARLWPAQMLAMPLDAKRQKHTPSWSKLAERGIECS